MFVLALVVVFLVLAAQFESFLHPFVIMTTVPLAVTGALLGLWFYGMSINVFSQIAAIMLVGLAAKNGILIVEFANQLRDRGVEYREAVIEAAAIRLRPVLMTSFCTAFGALPLMIATGRRRRVAPGDRRGRVLRRADLGAADACASCRPCTRWSRATRGRRRRSGNCSTGCGRVSQGFRAGPDGAGRAW